MHAITGGIAKFLHNAIYLLPVIYTLLNSSLHRSNSCMNAFSGGLQHSNFGAQ